MGKRFAKHVKEPGASTGCTLKLTGFPGYTVIIDVDEPALRKQIEGERCDYVIVTDDDNGKVFFLPMEFKTNNIDANRVSRQLAGGVKFFVKQLPNSVELLPFLVSRKIPPFVQKALNRHSVEYNGKKWPIQHALCNKDLLWKRVKRG